MNKETATRRNDDSKMLPEDFVPHEMDVICSWARQNHGHAGNKRFKELIDEYSPQYIKATTKLQKTEVIATVIEKIRSETISGGGFVKKDLYSGRWYEIGDEKARDKVGHAMRKAAELFHKEGNNEDEEGRGGNKKRKSKAAQSIKKNNKRGTSIKAPTKVLSSSSDTEKIDDRSVLEKNDANQEHQPYPEPVLSLSDPSLSTNSPASLQQNLAKNLFLPPEYPKVQDVSIIQSNTCQQSQSLPVRNLTCLYGVDQKNLVSHYTNQQALVLLNSRRLRFSVRDDMFQSAAFSGNFLSFPPYMRWPLANGVGLGCVSKKPTL